jgi:hypothetical protein
VRFSGEVKRFEKGGEEYNEVRAAKQSPSTQVCEVGLASQTRLLNKYEQMDGV